MPPVQIRAHSVPPRGMAVSGIVEDTAFCRVCDFRAVLCVYEREVRVCMDFSSNPPAFFFILLFIVFLPRGLSLC